MKAPGSSGPYFIDGLIWKAFRPAISVFCHDFVHSSCGSVEVHDRFIRGLVCVEWAVGAGFCAVEKGYW